MATATRHKPTPEQKAALSTAQKEHKKALLLLNKHLAATPKDDSREAAGAYLEKAIDLRGKESEAHGNLLAAQTAAAPAPVPDVPLVEA